MHYSNEYCTTLLRGKTTLEMFPAQVTRERRAVYKNMDYFKHSIAHLCFLFTAKCVQKWQIVISFA